MNDAMKNEMSVVSIEVEVRTKKRNEMKSKAVVDGVDNANVRRKRLENDAVVIEDQDENEDASVIEGSYKSLVSASVIHSGSGNANADAIKATSDSRLACDSGSVIVASPIEETKGEVTSANEMKKERMKAATSVSGKECESDSVIAIKIKGEATSVGEIKNKSKKSATSVSGKGFENDSVITMCQKRSMRTYCWQSYLALKEM